MNLSQPSNRVLFSAGAMHACELAESDIPALQGFFAANPEYFIAVNGMPPREDEAEQEFHEQPPPGMRFEKKYLIGFADNSGRLAGMASVLSNFLAERVWHIGLFIVATSLHGTGAASAWYLGLEDWMRRSGAQWIRLGVVAGNARAERFWEQVGYAQVRTRTGVQTGNLTSTIRVLVKCLGDGSVAEYLQLVERDRPDSMLH